MDPASSTATTIVVGRPITPQGGDGTVSSYHDWGDRSNFCTLCSVRILSLSATLLLFIAISVFVLGYLIKSNADGFTCPGSCPTLMTGVYVVGSVLCASAVLGFVAVNKESRCVTLLYAGILFLLCIGAAGFGVAAICISSGAISTNGLETAWTREVSDRDGAICTVQSSLECSGFSSCCGGVNFRCNRTSGTVNISFIPDVCNLTMNILIAQCSPVCDNNDEYLKPCQVALVASVRSHIILLSCVSFGAALLLFVSSGAGVRAASRRGRSEYAEIND